MDSDRETRIRERAYEIWRREGQPHGRDVEHWQKAAAEIQAETAVEAGGRPSFEPETVGAGSAPLRSRRVAKPGRDGNGLGASTRRSKRPGEH